MKTIKLIHPTLGVCAQAVIQNNRRLFSANQVKKMWQFRYGKKFQECSIVIESDEPESRPIINLKTGEKYHTVEEASKDIGVSKDTIKKHLNRKLSENNYDLYLVKWG